jgi:hypothetical protein
VPVMQCPHGRDERHAAQRLARLAAFGNRAGNDHAPARLADRQSRRERADTHWQSLPAKGCG